jgi:hypothetical protein
MRRYVIATAMAIGAMVVPAAAAQTPTQDSVTGSGLTEGPIFAAFSFLLDAHSGPSGEAPTGSVQISPVLFSDFEGPVTCLAVSGNVATLNFVIVEDAFVVTVTVTDSPAGDQIRLDGGIRAFNDCTPVPNAGGALLDSGDIVVVDAPPLPTAKDQCKNGSWQTYGVFKNQGDCVNFVAGKGKNPPATTTR